MPRFWVPIDLFDGHARLWVNDQMLEETKTEPTVKLAIEFNGSGEVEINSTDIQIAYDATVYGAAVRANSIRDG